MRTILNVLPPSLVLAAEAPRVPTGYDLFALPVGEVQAYVAGIVEGQRLPAEGLNVPQAACVDPIGAAARPLDGVFRRCVIKVNHFCSGWTQTMAR